MKRALLLIWLLIPVPLLYFHFGAGQSAMALERVRGEMAAIYAEIPAAMASGDRDAWETIEQALGEAIERVPADALELRRDLELDQLLAGMYAGELVPALKGIESALEVACAEGADPVYIQRLNEALARTLFGIGWVMRLEGSRRTEWQEVVERSRQQFRMLVELAEQDALRQRDLESTIGLLRMDRAELRGSPVPREARNGRGRGVGDQMGKRPGRGQGRGQGQGPQQPGDSRGKGAGLEELAKERGS